MIRGEGDVIRGEESEGSLSTREELPREGEGEDKAAPLFTLLRSAQGAIRGRAKLIE